MTTIEEDKLRYEPIRSDRKSREQLAMFLSAGWVVAISVVIGCLAWGHP
jgi:hypothetical protein